mmetsp:Transcript_11547/g.16566  ORF Transcript_11547/g.16566 Transcript_11547/m.16566 type:complete len:134 (+) Transcript_11547:51-452(+)|eukprot:CAMPEP_0201688034 /NCGR_PEP_ID=MMETSP0578-20130828/1818_1 /ASSEMBLY_ACC=CAM_ASM_000663 /TAXON_ID=267565 /ORGANISM="Skeletonema grethea, Strain CCMP 1804" /LENGTH=133 /DNA_ID=CAMNT_0048172223 /DNA_START=49 /DNA_END=450 /DNA_ORIENTATION=+
MMQRILFFSLTALVLAVPRHVAAFSSKSSPSIVQISRATYDVPRTKVSLQQSTENSTAQAEDTDDVTCFIVNDEEIITEKEKPHVVCTSEPDDYAWFNGVDPENMREVDGVVEGVENCVQGESFKGKPEWECE